MRHRDDAHEHHHADTDGAADELGHDALSVEFCGEHHRVLPGATLTFGRSADVAVDDNPYLHRVLGCFVHHGDTWWLHHQGRAGALTVRDRSGPSAAVVAPGTSVALAWPESVVAFDAGPATYELDVVLERRDWFRDVIGPVDGAPRTLEWGTVELNPDQRLLLVAMCEARLRAPSDPGATVPANREGAARLRWTIRKYNRKLDHLCDKLARAGVRGVRGDLATQAGDRRRRVVDHALAAGLVTVDDLELLDAPDAPDLLDRAG